MRNSLNKYSQKYEIEVQNSFDGEFVYLQCRKSD